MYNGFAVIWGLSFRVRGCAARPPPLLCNGFAVNDGVGVNECDWAREVHRRFGRCTWVAWLKAASALSMIVSDSVGWA